MDETLNDDTLSERPTLGRTVPEEKEPEGPARTWTDEDAERETMKRPVSPEEMTLAGRYKVLRRLGEGGMGSVWLAEDLKLDGRKVAVKMLPSVLAGKKAAYKQVKQEALMAMKLSHPNIATVRAFEEEDRNPFLVMDYIEGQGLDVILAEKGKLSEEETLRLLTPVAAALDYAHAQGVVHRDVKPGNVIVRKDGIPFVLDFGIAREIQETMTRVTGKFSSGTLLYMSPEQLNGDQPRATQDVYSFAAMTYECLKGEPPFVRGGIEDQIKHKVPSALPDHVGEALRNGIMAGLAKDAKKRPGTCAEVLARVTKKIVPHLRKRKGLGWGRVVTLVLALGICVWWWQEHRTKTRREHLAQHAEERPAANDTTTQQQAAVEHPVEKDDARKMGQDGLLAETREEGNCVEEEQTARERLDREATGAPWLEQEVEVHAQEALEVGKKEEEEAAQHWEESEAWQRAELEQQDAETAPTPPVLQATGNQQDGETRTNAEVANDIPVTQIVARVPPQPIPRGMSPADFVRILLDKQKTDVALATVQKARVDAPNDPDLATLEGIALIRLRYYAAAADLLRALSVKHPNDAAIQANLGAAWIGDGFYAGARKALQKAIALNPNIGGEYYYNLALVCALTEPRDLETARSAYLKAIDTGVPRDPQLDALLY